MVGFKRLGSLPVKGVLQVRAFGRTRVLVSGSPKTGFGAFLQGSPSALRALLTFTGVLIQGSSGSLNPKP